MMGHTQNRRLTLGLLWVWACPITADFLVGTAKTDKKGSKKRLPKAESEC